MYRLYKGCYSGLGNLVNNIKTERIKKHIFSYRGVLAREYRVYVGFPSETFQ